MANTKTTRDRAAQTAARLLRKSGDPDVLRVAGSALAQSDPRPDKRRPRGQRKARPRPTAKFKAGKDLADDSQEGGGAD